MLKAVNDKTKRPLELIHMDLCGTAPLNSNSGHKYYLSLVDDFTRYIWIYPLNDKAQTTAVFIKFKDLIENLTNCKIKNLQSNWGPAGGGLVGGGCVEFRTLKGYIETHGINFRHPCPYTSHQNGSIEKKH